MAAAQKKLYEDFFDKTDAMGQKDGNVSIQELKKMVVEGLGQKKTDQEIAVSIKSGGSERWRERGGKNMQTTLARSHKTDNAPLLGNKPGDSQVDVMCLWYY
uniref:Uncharacterized protein n=1 Tax=Magallana gigas TaxID=29159 RepID=K1QAP7_MAGGI